MILQPLRTLDSGEYLGARAQHLAGARSAVAERHAAAGGFDIVRQPTTVFP